MRKLTALPTWLLTMFILRFFPLHDGYAWVNRKFTLSDWHAHQTPLCKQFDLVFWITGLGILLALTRILFY